MGPDSGAGGWGAAEARAEGFPAGPGQEGAAGTSLGSRGLGLHAPSSGGPGWAGPPAGKRRPHMGLSAANKKKRARQMRGCGKSKQTARSTQ